AFFKFMTSDQEMYMKAVKTGSYWPTTFQPSSDQVAQLEPLSYSLTKQADSVKYTYPHAKFATPDAFSSTGINDWPAYVQGKMSTSAFLGALSDAVSKSKQ